MEQEQIFLINKTVDGQNMEQILREGGYEIRKAKDEGEAFDFIKEQRADYVLLASEVACDSFLNEKAVDTEGKLVIDTGKRSVKKDGTEIALTPTEYNLLTTMAKSPNRIFTREQLIAYALADEYRGYDRSIDTHIKELRRKLKENGRNPHYIHTVHGIGYKFVP